MRTLRVLRQAIGRVPALAWWAVAGYLAVPWLIRYWVWSLGGCVEFFFPTR
jgi:hypothetical protein